MSIGLIANREDEHFDSMDESPLLMNEYRAGRAETGPCEIDDAAQSIALVQFGYVESLLTIAANSGIARTQGIVRAR